LKAIALFSGGLDSILAIKIIEEQGIEVIALNFDFGLASTTDKNSQLQQIAKEMEINLVIADVRQEYLDEVLFSPKYGYGSAFNPCIDCHGNMFKWAKKYMDRFDAKFVISGEVLNERPMSQRMDSLKKVEKLSNLQGYVLRPLSAKFLEPTIPEINGWVDRDKLLDIKGRSRKKQFELVKKYRLNHFEMPGGGCLLTESFMAVKIKDFTKYDKFEVEDMEVIKYGRHFRISPVCKLVVGRHKEDNEKIKPIKNTKFWTVFMPTGVSGPVSLVSKSATEDDLQICAKIILTYGKTQADKEYKMVFGDSTIMQKPFLSKDEVKKYMLQGA